MADTDRRLWLFFSLVEGISAWAPHRRPQFVLVVGALRIMDVPADLVYLVSARDLGWFGTLSLVGSPLFNFLAGTYLLRISWKFLRRADSA